MRLTQPKGTLPSCRDGVLLPILSRQIYKQRVYINNTEHQGSRAFRGTEVLFPSHSFPIALDPLSSINLGSLSFDQMLSLSTGLLDWKVGQTALSHGAIWKEKPSVLRAPKGLLAQDSQQGQVQCTVFQQYSGEREQPFC